MSPRSRPYRTVSHRGTARYATLQFGIKPVSAERNLAVDGTQIQPGATWNGNASRFNHACRNQTVWDAGNKTEIIKS